MMRAKGTGTIAPRAVAGEAFESLTALRSRSVLALVGVMIGIGSVIAMISVADIAREESMKRFRALGTDIVTARTRYSSERGRVITFPLDTLLQADMEMTTVGALGAWSNLSGEITWRGAALEGVRPLGVTEGFAKAMGLKAAEGRFISDLDYRQYYCVIGARVARMMAPDGGSPIGERVRIGERLWTVLGVLAPSSARRAGGPPDGSIYVPMTTAMLSNGRDSIGDIIVKAAEGVESETVADGLVRYFQARVPGIVMEANTAEELLRGMRDQSRLFALLLGVVGAISLIMGAVGIMNVMLLGVAERKSEIGLRRAIGARRRDIRGQFLLEAVMLCAAGGVLGIGTGFGTAWGISAYANWEFFTPWTAALWGLIVATAVGIVCGLYPAHRAATLDPIEALRA